MPELPEVETIRRGLADVLPGARIASVDVLFEKSMPVSAEKKKTYVIGAEITSVRRRGKVMIINLSSGYSLLIHLKMTGQLIFDVAPSREISGKQEEYTRIGGGHPTKSMAADLPDKSTRVVFALEDGSKLYFNDQRKFGWIKVVESLEVAHENFFKTMGPEPLEEDFRDTDLESRVKHRTTAIKTALLDQDNVAGLGNIYTDEALHLAKIHPIRAGNSLSSEEISRLHEAIIKVLQNSIDDGGTSFTSYVDVNGVSGDYLRNARVYRREGESCLECGTVIEKIKIGQRGTHICPKCQVV